MGGCYYVNSPMDADPASVIAEALRRRASEAAGLLSPYAALPSRSRGREAAEPGNERAAAAPFQVDRERIVRTKTFRRLMHKTQVFMAPAGDHYLTRLTHTMEVSLLARAVARALRLNEDLTEAVCMGHDLGHAPFGHLGESALAAVHPGGFRHNRQSVRVVEQLENDGRGLNLTWEVRQGILRHSKGRSGIEGNANPELDTLEGQTAKIADALAYINHDTDDAVRAKAIAGDDIPADVVETLGSDRAGWAQRMAADIVAASWEASGETKAADGEPPVIRMSAEMSSAANRMRDFLFERVYEPASATPQAERAREIIRLLYDYFSRFPDRIPDEYRRRDEAPERMALDYVSGMTDSYALRVAEAISPSITSGFQEQGVRVSFPAVPA